MFRLAEFHFITHFIFYTIIQWQEYVILQEEEHDLEI